MLATWLGLMLGLAIATSEASINAAIEDKQVNMLDEKNCFTIFFL